MKVCLSLLFVNAGLHQATRFGSNATWNLIGEELATGDSSNNFYPINNFANINNKIYICCSRSGSSPKSQYLLFPTKLKTKDDKGRANVPTSVFVRSNGVIYVSMDGKHIEPIKTIWKYVEKEKKMKVDSECQGLFVISFTTVYCSIKNSHQVTKSFFETRNEKKGNDKNKRKRKWATVAGKGGKGPAPNQLYHPHGIYVDHDNLDLYVADTDNNRIQLFKNQSSSGQTVVNSSIRFDNKKLSEPTYVILDAAKNVYIADTGNHRIVVFEIRSNLYRCLVGSCLTTTGSLVSSLNRPMSISFDGLGNLFVSDNDYQRIQQFTLSKENFGKYECSDLKFI